MSIFFIVAKPPNIGHPLELLSVFKRCPLAEVTLVGRGVTGTELWKQRRDFETKLFVNCLLFSGILEEVYKKESLIYKKLFFRNGLI